MVKVLVDLEFRNKGKKLSGAGEQKRKYHGKKKKLRIGGLTE
jgi:hypothetical protein